MKYKTEIVRNGSIVTHEFLSRFSHPNQVARYTTSKYRALPAYILLVMNEGGDVWKYSVVRRGKNIHVRKMEKDGGSFSQNDVDMVFTGNKSLARLML